ncbi:uncharacterized protein EAF01_011233 [Botrytis porri]|uniref:uncharacterized protein n=1 Tax=Botrytis porri TaxID=87229 RepID=UPI001901C87E|nr:uncharacterized protein EAF01_011233 [Botrytis porri]KAF7886555.1 hypothetical protein EAF01_011233 [Botrytis porri]
MAPVLPLSPDKMTLNFISYSDANTSDESTSASSFYPSHTSQSPYAQVAYQQHGSNHIDSHSPTLSYPSSSVQNQGIHSMGRNKSSDLDNMRTVAIDQLCSISFPSVCLHPQCQDHFKHAHHKQYLCGLPSYPNSDKRYGTEAEAKRHRISVHRFGKADARHWDC